MASSLSNQLHVLFPYNVMNLISDYSNSFVTFYVHPTIKAVRVLTSDDPDYGKIQYWKDSPIPMIPYTTEEFKSKFPDLASSYFQ